MSKARNKELTTLGDIYGDILNNVTVTESVKPGDIGDAPLKDGGPQAKGGFVPAAVDKKALKPRALKDNLFNIDNLSEEDEEGCECEEGCDCAECKAKEAEDKKSVAESTKSGQKSLNNFMRNKSVFDKLYENVMGGSFGRPAEDAEESNDLDALGLGDDAGEEGLEGDGEGEDSVTLTLDRETASKLHELLAGVLGGEEGLEGDEPELGSEGGDAGAAPAGNPFGEEDEEETLGTAGSVKYDDGKKNKVGTLKVSSGGASSKSTDKVGNDGELGHPGSAKYNDGKNNKVGTLKTGKAAFEQ